MDTAMEILKWVLIVLAAGFVGYFGKALGMWIIAKFQKKDKGQTPPVSGTSDKGIDYKIKKKEAKAEYKLKKKENNGESK